MDKQKTLVAARVQLRQIIRDDSSGCFQRERIFSLLFSFPAFFLCPDAWDAAILGGYALDLAKMKSLAPVHSTTPHARATIRGCRM